MFEMQIKQAQDLIRRTHLCSERGLDAVAKAEWISGVEQNAWYSGTEGLIRHVFGEDSNEMQRYRSTIEARSQLLRAAADRGDPKWDFTYWVEHYHQMIGLLQEFEAKYVAKQSEKPHFKELHMGDKYYTGVAGAVGPGAQNFGQVWSQVGGNIPLDKLGPELGRLREAMKSEAMKSEETKPEQDMAIGAVAAAQQAANNGSGPKALEYLKSAGEWALQVAEKIGVGVATAAIKSSLGV
jgi:hypothetical protein